jgi:demethylmenaquinone methyltransferase/2-methoxy-6-polyprenyl-1,4-benzoquinol methylase
MAAFGVGDALRLPFRSSSFDLVTSGFLLRNLTDLKRGFVEMRRVLRPGGVLLALDLTEPSSQGFGRFFHAYLDKVVPVVGAAFRSEEAYRYLSDSLRTFPPRARVAEMLTEAGFSTVMCRPQWGGVVTGFFGKAGE